MRLGRAQRIVFRSQRPIARSKAHPEGFGLHGPDRLLCFLRTRPCFQPYRLGLGLSPLVWLKSSRPIIAHRHHLHLFHLSIQRHTTRLQLAMQVLVNHQWHRFRHAVTVASDHTSHRSTLLSPWQRAPLPAYATMPILARFRTRPLPNAEAPKPAPAAEGTTPPPLLPAADVVLRPRHLNRRELPAETMTKDGPIPHAPSPVGPRTVAASQADRTQTLVELFDDLNSSQISRITDGILREIDDRIIVARERRSGG